MFFQLPSVIVAGAKEGVRERARHRHRAGEQSFLLEDFGTFLPRYFAAGSFELAWVMTAPCAILQCFNIGLSAPLTEEEANTLVWCA